MSIQLIPPGDPAVGGRLPAAARRRAISDGRRPGDDDAPYPAAGGWFWDLMLEQKQESARR